MRWRAAVTAVLGACATCTPLLASPQAARTEPVLLRTIALRETGALLADVLARMRHDLGVRLAWSGDVLPPAHRVTIDVRDVRVDEALRQILSGTNLEFIATRNGTVVIVPAAPPRGGAVPGAVPVVAQALSATGVPRLDAVVVIGSAVERSPEREQPAAIAIVTPATIDALPNARVGELLQMAVPGVALWDRGHSSPPAPFTAVRGISSFTTRGIKTYVDGIELASPELFTIADARSIERIEVIRGPQGAALYGPDALNGLVQIETRRGTPGRDSIELRAFASAGGQSRQGLASAALVQDYAAGTAIMRAAHSLDVSAAFVRAAADGRVPLAESWSAAIGTRSIAGPLRIDLSARGGRRNYAIDSVAVNGDVVSTTRALGTIEERSVAATVVHAAGARWRQTVVAGVHEAEGARESFHSPLLVPVLPRGATDEHARRATLRYSTTVDAAPALQLSAGAEHTDRYSELRVRGSRNLIAGPRYLRATGGFAQARARIRNQVVMSAGTRAERVSSVHPDAGLLWASTAGATWIREVSGATIRLRSAWGHGIRPPEPGMNAARQVGTAIQEANPMLRSETQRGIEGGVDVYLRNGNFLTFTAYDQRASGLIQPVRIDRSQRYQFQNVGIVRNRGVEVDIGVQWRSVDVRTVAQIPHSSIERIGAAYTGDLRIGDELLEVPDGSGSFTLGFTARRVTTTLGTTWLGSWTGFDRVAIAREQANPRADRAYWRRYDGVLRPFIAVSATGGAWTAYIRVDNPANDAIHVRDNLSPALGRAVAIGIAHRDQR